MNNIILNLPILAVESPDHVLQALEKHRETISHFVAHNATWRNRLQTSFLETLQQQSSDWPTAAKLFELVMQVFVALDGKPPKNRLSWLQRMELSSLANPYEIQLDSTRILLQSGELI
ncbi:hypothetical protein Ciccas_005081 [Cichlidogyrus casuarinus]|uniref:Uncharacterized protein n=1 Tax=Cichlidogyrus casuarinus TaxID=1844966 RepID=A0ABD2Q9N3_9PLAT